jgi:hypothetical protein
MSTIETGLLRRLAEQQLSLARHAGSMRERHRHIFAAASLLAYSRELAPPPTDEHQARSVLD